MILKFLGCPVFGTAHFALFSLDSKLFLGVYQPHDHFVCRRRYAVLLSETDHRAVYEIDLGAAMVLYILAHGGFAGRKVCGGVHERGKNHVRVKFLTVRRGDSRCLANKRICGGAHIGIGRDNPYR